MGSAADYEPEIRPTKILRGSKSFSIISHKIMDRSGGKHVEANCQDSASRRQLILGSLAFMSTGICREASLMISSSRSTANRSIILSVKLAFVWPANAPRISSIAVSMCAMRSLMVGCTSEYLEYIVRNPLGEARRD